MKKILPIFVAYQLLFIFSFVLSAPKPIHGKIQFFEEDPYWSVYHFYGLEGGVKKEAAVSAYNQNMQDVEYALKVSSLDAPGMEEEVPLGSSKNQSFKKVVEFPLLTQKEKLQLVAKVDGDETVLDEETNEEEKMPYTFSLTATHPPDPLDYGMFLLPKNKILVPTNGPMHLSARIFLPYGRTKNISWELSLKEPHVILKSGSEKLGETNTGYVWDYEDISLFAFKLPLGEHKVFFTAKDTNSQTTLISEERTLIVVPNVKAAGFFTHKTKINYTEPVYIHSDQKNYTTKSWNELWKDGPHDDIVVSFTQGFKLLFWRGASYIPVFTFGNIGMTYEWIEAAGSWGRPPGTKVRDCVEPLMDKECRFSRVEIVSSTPARTVIHWHYALIDLNYYNPDNETADEYYYMYPDGFGVRYVEAKIKPDAWHEESEFIVLIPPGYNPFELIEDNDVTLYSPDGKKKWQVTHPKPNIQWEANQPTVYRVHLKNNPYTPVMVTPNLEKQSSFDGWQNKKRYISPSYWGDHWPVTRGFETRNSPPEFYRVRPTHASLVSTYHKPLTQTPLGNGLSMTRWAWLIGITNLPDDAVLKIARNFLTPPQLVPQKGLTSVSYDMTQRAYVLMLKPGAKTASFIVKGEDELVHPAFVVKNMPTKTVQVVVNGKLLKNEIIVHGNEGKYGAALHNYKAKTVNPMDILVMYGNEGKDCVIFLNTLLHGGDAVKLVFI